jgi:hypothetical protein
VPADLVAAIDGVVGRRHRDRFIAKTLAAELRRRRLKRALDEVAGSLADVDIPGWETPEAAAEWGRAQRRGEPPFRIAIAIDDCTS